MQKSQNQTSLHCLKTKQDKNANGINYTARRVGNKRSNMFEITISCYLNAYFKYFTNTTAKLATQNTTISVALGANFKRYLAMWKH